MIKKEKEEEKEEKEKEEEEEANEVNFFEVSLIVTCEDPLA